MKCYPASIPAADLETSRLAKCPRCTMPLVLKDGATDVHFSLTLGQALAYIAQAQDLLHAARTLVEDEVAP